MMFPYLLTFTDTYSAVMILILALIITLPKDFEVKEISCRDKIKSSSC